MKGVNQIIMNPDEMNRAIEYYLNHVQLKEPVVVQKIEQNWDNGAITGFKVSVTEDPNVGYGDGTRDTQP